ncbi:MAG TPA: type III-B CRISPR module RAMP protein Cmr6 [Negativicutes bacterium]|nr:type III-B CRISPR module RAMP protein Cmr6 [Negativicutes bacterium]
MSNTKGQTKRAVEHGSIHEQLLNMGYAAPDQVIDASENLVQQNAQIQEMFNIGQTRLPRDTRDVLGNTEPENFALKLNRQVFWCQDKKKTQKPILFKKEKDSTYRVRFEFDRTLIKEISERQLSAIQNLGLKCNVMDFKIDWRLVVGLGNESVYETSMTLHHVYGFPYIPASAVKGVVRSWIITELFGEHVGADGKQILDFKHAEERAMKNNGFRDLFGDTDVAGKISFFDAFPVTVPKIDIDIMNPHYGEYYADQAGLTAPADYLTPVPIPFLTVKDAIYRFVLGVRTDANDVMRDDSLNGQGCSSLEVASKWLENALTKHGIGAKTAVGYGYMTLQK